LLWFDTWGGGGWGDPLTRAAAAVAADVARGLVTAAGARRYGVVLDAAGAVDGVATPALREELRAARAPLALIDKGGAIAELKARCLAETGLEPPAEPVFSRRASR